MGLTSLGRIPTLPLSLAMLASGIATPGAQLGGLCGGIFNFTSREAPATHRRKARSVWVLETSALTCRTCISRSLQPYSQELSFTTNLGVQGWRSGQGKCDVHVQCNPFSHKERTKVNKVLAFVEKWMQLETSVLSQPSRFCRDSHDLLSFICGSLPG